MSSFEIPNLNAWRWRAQVFGERFAGTARRPDHTYTAFEVARFFDNLDTYYSGDEEEVVRGFTRVMQNPAPITEAKTLHESRRLSTLLAPVVQLDRIDDGLKVTSVKVHDAEALIYFVQEIPFGSSWSAIIPDDDTETRIYAGTAITNDEYRAVMTQVLGATLDGSIYSVTMPGSVKSQPQSSKAPFGIQSLASLAGESARASVTDQRIMAAEFIGHLRRSPLEDIVTSISVFETVRALDDSLRAATAPEAYEQLQLTFASTEL